MPVENTDDLREMIVKGIDSTLEAPWVVRRWLSADNIRVLRATRRYWLADDGTQLTKLLALVEQEPRSQTTRQGDHMSYPYPPGVPTDEIRDLISYLRGAEPTDLNHAVHCGWVVTGFGLSQVLPCPAHAAAAPKVTSSTPMTAANAAEELEKLLHPEAFGAVQIPWDLILPVLFELVRRWLESR